MDNTKIGGLPIVAILVVALLGLNIVQASAAMQDSYPLITDTGSASSFKANIVLNCTEQSITVESEGEGLAILMYANLIIDRQQGNLSYQKLSYYGKLPYITEPFSLRIDWKSGESRIVEFSLDKCKEENIGSAYLVHEIEMQENTTNKKTVNKTTTVEEGKKNKSIAANKSTKKTEPREENTQGICATITALLAAIGLSAKS